MDRLQRVFYIVCVIGASCLAGCADKKQTGAKRQETTAEPMKSTILESSTENARALYQQKRFKESFKIYAQLAEAGDAESQHQSGVMCILGQGTRKSVADSVKWFRLAAVQGYAPSEFSLGLRYLNGEGVKQDLLEAVKWFRKSADKGYAIAQFRLGLQYRDGAGIDKNLVEAYKWMRVGALNGRPGTDKAIQELATQMAPDQIADGDQRVEAFQSAGLAAIISYETGKTLQKQKTYGEALRIFEQLAKNGDPKAQHELGVMYFLGQGVEKNAKEAVKWYKLAAERNLPEAQFNLGLRYANGEGVELDSSEALKYFLLAAEKRLPAAQLRLGIQYRDGRDVEKDLVEAYKWIQLAAKAGRADAETTRETLEKEMTSEQIAEGELRVAQFSAPTESVLGK